MTCTATMLLVSGDLLLGTTVNRHGQAAGYEVVRCLSNAKAMLHLAEQKFQLVVVELGMDGLDFAAVVQQSQPAQVLGFAGHVQTEQIARAQAAGMTVLTNGQIHSQGEAVFRKLRPEA